jgi:hypothetical protein
MRLVELGISGNYSARYAVRDVASDRLAAQPAPQRANIARRLDGESALGGGV